MTQKDFDRRFDALFKIGFGTLVLGFVAATAGVPLALISDWFGLAFAGIFVGIFGGIICVANFAHDIFYNPRWKR